MSRDCDRDDVDELLDQLEATDNWAVEDWDFSVGRFEEPEVELTLQWSPPLPRGTMQAVKDAIHRYDDDAMPQEELIEELPHEGVERALDELKTMGEVYEPRDGYLRVT